MDPENAEKAKERVLEMMGEELAGEDVEQVVEQVVEEHTPANKSTSILDRVMKKIKMDRNIMVGIFKMLF